MFNSDQISRFGRSAHSESIFFGLKFDAVVCGRILEVAGGLTRDHGLSGRLFDADTLHLTLCEPGNPIRLREDLVDALKAAGSLVRFSPIVVEFDRAIGFNAPTNGYPNVLLASTDSAAALSSLRQTIVNAQLFQGLRVPRSGFKPHVTLSRSSKLWNFQGAIAPIAFIASELLLIHSYHDGKHRQHDAMGRWPLAVAP